MNSDYWIIKCDHEERLYKSTASALRGWVETFSMNPKATVKLYGTHGVIELTDFLVTLTWPKHKELHNAGLKNDANYDHHMSVCMSNEEELNKIFSKKRVCPWFEFMAELRKEANKEMRSNAALLEEFQPHG